MINRRLFSISKFNREGKATCAISPDCDRTVMMIPSKTPKAITARTEAAQVPQPHFLPPTERAAEGLRE